MQILSAERHLSDSVKIQIICLVLFILATFEAENGNFIPDSFHRSCVFQKHLETELTLGVKQLLVNAALVQASDRVESCHCSAASHHLTHTRTSLTLASTSTHAVQRQTPTAAFLTSSALPPASSGRPCSLVPLSAVCSGRPHRF